MTSAIVYDDLIADIKYDYYDYPNRVIGACANNVQDHAFFAHGDIGLNLHGKQYSLSDLIDRIEQLECEVESLQVQREWRDD